MKKSNVKNPITKYPGPPFKKQSQPIQGMTSKMNPVPDHGEKSYKGHGLLQDRLCIITGGDSGIGKAVAIAMAREGAHVVISYLDKMEDADANDTIKWVKEAGVEGMAIRGDIRREKMCQQIVDK